MQPYYPSDLKNQQTQTRPREFIEIESPIPQRRALSTRRPLALMFGGSVTVLTVWMLAILGSAATAVPGALPIVAVQGGGAAIRRQRRERNSKGDPEHPALQPGAAGADRTRSRARDAHTAQRANAATHASKNAAAD